MTPELAACEAAILRIRHAAHDPRPLPPDRFLRARVLCVASCDLAEAFLSVAIAKSAIADSLVIEVRELMDQVVAWEKAASGFLGLVDEERACSPFPALLEAMQGREVEEVKGDGE